MAIYQLHSHKAAFNLAFEQWIFENGPPHQINLLIWRDSPCIVIGRNQNPWVECNVPAIRSMKEDGVKLLRRFSGGGTVFHDLGCLIFSFIMPKGQFQRDFYANLVAKSLSRLYPSLANHLIVGPRHDIFFCNQNHNYGLKYGEVDGKMLRDFYKVSGSAFRIGKHRAYHHGTLLLNSNMADLKHFLHSPLPPEWKLDGANVSSVPSPVANLSEVLNKALDHQQVSYAIIDEARQGQSTEIPVFEIDQQSLPGTEFSETKQLLESDEWTFNKTPPFTLAHPTMGKIRVEEGLVAGESLELTGTSFNSWFLQQTLQHS